jgi:general secretion pathway protein N
MGLLLERQSAGRLTLGDPQGTLWNGSAFVGGAAGGNDPVTPLVPGRFVWRLSPALLLGQLDLLVENSATLSQPVQITGSWDTWQVSAAALELPAERLAGLGAPLNTIAPSGQLRLRWNSLQVVQQGQANALLGSMTLEMRDIASRLSAIKPLGAYDLTIDWRGQQAQVELKTLKGPLLLSGSGALHNGRLQFAGQAESQAGQEERLANLLNLLGQRRTEGNRNIIALEFK